MIRHSLKFVPWKDRKQVAGDLKSIYIAVNVESATRSLEIFAEKWDGKYPTISESWRLSQRYISDETIVSGVAGHGKEVDTTDQRLDNGAESVFHFVWRAVEDRGLRA